MGGQFIVDSCITQFAIGRDPLKWARCSISGELKGESDAFLFVSAIQLFGIEHQNLGTCAATPSYIC